MFRQKNERCDREACVTMLQRQTSGILDVIEEQQKQIEIMEKQIELLLDSCQKK